MNNPLYTFDQQIISQQGLFVGGIDEAGRGPLAGPVVAACVLLSHERPIAGLNDSKKLSAKKRIALEITIKQDAICWSVASCPASLIDEINILEAAKMAMALAYQNMRIKPVHLLIDALTISYLPVSQNGIIKGDMKSASIAAASILAKQERDRIMHELHYKYPLYHFDKHKGYPTKKHYEQLRLHGPCPEHRLTFQGVI